MSSSPPDPGARPRREPDAGWRRWTSPIDIAIAAAIGAWAALEVVLIPSTNSIGQILFAALVSVPLIVRRRLPAVVMLVVAGSFVAHAAIAGADATFNPFPSLLVCTYTVAERVTRWWLSAALGLAPIAAMLGAHELGYFGSPGIESTGTAFLVFFVGATWAVGRILRQRALAADRARENSARLAVDAVAAERARIARELHDVVAHALSIIALQSGAADQFLDKDTERARHHLRHTRRTAQEALTEMRHLLDVLREEAPLYTPQPGVSDIAALAAETRDAGHECTVDIDPTAVDIPDGHGLAVYRVVQESLTNARKHAPGARIDVRVRLSAGAVDVVVQNGPGVHRGTASAGGQGLHGMGERARVYGGTLEAGPVDGGGWRVHLRLPLADA